MTTKVPTIPTITDGDVTQILSSVKMLLDVREGRVGDKLDANVTYRDLVGLNLVKDPTGSVVYTGATGAAANLPVRPFGTDSDGYDPTADLTPPPAPESVSALGSIGAIFLSWSTPSYKNHAFAEIWRSGIDDVATAVLIGTSPTQGFVDIPGDNLPRYYWVRFASRADVRGPYSQNSVSATASPDPAVLIAAISGQITESSLAQSLSQRISTIESSKDLVGSLQNTVARLKGSTDAAILQEQTTRIAADSALATQINGVAATTGSNTSAIADEITARTSADTALATSISTLSSTVAGNTTAISNEQTARAEADSALATSISNLSTTVSNNTTAISNEQTARADADSALATSISNLSTTVGSNTTAISEEAIARANADGTLFAQYTVKIDANGYVSGFGLASSGAADNPFSEFHVRTDRFAIVNPSVNRTEVSSVTVPGDNSYTQLNVPSGHGIVANDKVSLYGDPAFVGAYTVSAVGTTFIRIPYIAASRTSGATLYVAKVSVPFVVDGGNVYIDNAFIKAASITSAQIATLAANKITAGNINATIGINGGKVYGAELYAGGTVAVEENGSFTANNPTVKIAGGNATFVASNFKISNSATGTPTDYTPFQVVNDVVRINTALIANAAITLAQIDTANITNLSSIKADMGTITAGKMQSSDGKFVIDLDNKTISIEV
jgi:hypothetical protein